MEQKREKECVSMNKKQRVMLSRILAAAALLILFQFLPLTGVVRFLAYLVPYLVIGYDILLKAGKGIRNRLDREPVPLRPPLPPGGDRGEPAGRRPV